MKWARTTLKKTPVAFMIDDFTPDNGSMLVMPGSHRGPIYDHRAKGRFVGGMEPLECGLLHDELHGWVVFDGFPADGIAVGDEDFAQKNDHG